MRLNDGLIVYFLLEKVSYDSFYVILGYAPIFSLLHNYTIAWS